MHQPVIRILKDKARTRVLFNAVTSYSQDYDLNGGSNKVLTLILSIGSAVVKLRYDAESERDADVILLDDYFNAEVNPT